MRLLEAKSSWPVNLVCCAPGMLSVAGLKLLYFRGAGGLLDGCLIVGILPRRLRSSSS